MKLAPLALLVLCTAPVVGAQDLPSGPVSLANGMVVIGTDLSISLTPQDDTDGAWFNYTDYEHNALRLFRVAVNADVRLTDRVSVLTEIRSENGDNVKPYALYVRVRPWRDRPIDIQGGRIPPTRSEEHTSELQSQSNLVCRLLLEKKKNKEKSQT